MACVLCNNNKKINKNGIFCKYCVLFIKKGGKDRAIQLNKFVREPLKKYTKDLEKNGDFEVYKLVYNNYSVAPPP